MNAEFLDLKKNGYPRSREIEIRVDSNFNPPDLGLHKNGLKEGTNNVTTKSSALLLWTCGEKRLLVLLVVALRGKPGLGKTPLVVGPDRHNLYK